MPGKQKSDLSRAFSEDGAHKTHIGGQALIEGVMMRGKLNWAVAVREPSGDIYTEEHDLASGKQKNKWMYKPLIRGCVALVESLGLGYKALEIAATHAYGEELEEDAAATGDAVPMSTPAGDAVPTSATGGGSASTDASVPAATTDGESGGLGKGAMTVSMILGLVLGIVLFVVAPAALTNFIVGEYDDKTILWNVVDGILRVAVFIAYIWLIGRMKDIKRMFAYHGAEHKTIHCYEHGLELTPENARRFPRMHVRCGTAFMIMVMIIAILVYTIVPLNPLIEAWGVPDGILKLILVIIVRIIFLPVIAGISYEINVKWAGAHPESPVVKVILWPGMQMQYLTTNEPDDSMLECAIAAMKMVLAREEREALEKGR